MLIKKKHLKGMPKALTDFKPLCWERRGGGNAVRELLLLHPTQIPAQQITVIVIKIQK